MACAPVEQAVTTEWLGPLKPYLIEIWPEARLIRQAGIKKGLTRFEEGDVVMAGERGEFGAALHAPRIGSLTRAPIRGRPPTVRDSWEASLPNSPGPGAG